MKREAKKKKKENYRLSFFSDLSRMTARALEICGQKGQIPDDAAVFDYCDKLIQVNPSALG